LMDSPLLAFQAVSMISITDAVCYLHKLCQPSKLSSN